MYCRLIAVLFLVACSSSGLSQGPDTPSPKTGANADFDGAAKLAQEAIDQLKSNGVPGFIGAIFSGRKGTLKESDRPAAEAMFSRLYADATVRHGKSRGQIELVRTDSVGRSIVRFIYLDKLERGGAIWHLAFYRGDGNDWQWVGFRMTESFDPEFRTVKSDEEFKDARSMAHQAMDGLTSRSIPGLFDVLLAEGKTLMAADRTFPEGGFTSLRQKAIAQQGKPLGVTELVRTEAIGSSVVRFVFLEKHERSGYIWKLTLYRTGSQWKWLNLNLCEWGNEFETAR